MMSTRRGLAMSVVVAASLAAAAPAGATVTASPDPVAIGAVDLGTTGSSATALSTDQASETIDSFDLSACRPDFAVTTPPPVTVTNGVTTPIAVAFTPSQMAAASCTVLMKDSGGTLLGTFQITGSGLQGLLAVAPGTTAFGGVRIGDTVPRTFTLSNPGNAAVTNITATLDNTTVGYAITSPAFPLASLAAGGSITVTVQFAPAQATDGGSHSIAFSGTWGGSAQTANATEGLTGTALVAMYDTNPTQAAGLSFGTTRYDLQIQKTIDIVNTSPGATTPVRVMSLGITPQTALPGEYSIIGCTHGGLGLACPTPTSPFTLAGNGDTLTVVLKLLPANRLAAMTAMLDVHTDLGVNADRHVPLTGQSTSAEIAVTPGMLVDFGPSDIDAPAQLKTITVQNLGSASLTLGATAPSCVGPCPYAFGATTAQTVPPGGTFTVNVTYTPTLEKTGPCPGANCDVATITWPYNGVCGTGATCMGPSTVTVTIAGRGIDRHVLAPPPPTFPDTFRNPGTSAPVLPVTIQNTGEAMLHVSAAMVSGAPVWQLIDTAPVDVPGHGSHGFQVKFAPTAAGKAPDGALVITDNDNGVPMVTIMLQGTGINRNVELGPSAIDLGYTGIDIPVRLSAVAPGQLLSVASLDPAHTFTIRSIEVDDAAFAVLDSSGNTPANLMLAPSTTEQFDILFTPHTEGDFTATATLFLDEDPTAQAVVQVQGHAVFADAHGGGGCNAGSGGGAGALALVGAIALALRRRRAGAAAALAVIAAAGAARADDRDLDLTVFNPTPATTGTFFQLQPAAAGDNGAWVVSGLASYASNPLVIETVQNTDAAVNMRTMLSLGGAYAFLGRYEAGAHMPLYIQDGDTTNQATTFGVPPASGTARGDLTLHGKAQLWRGAFANGELVAGASLALTLPTATAGEFAGIASPEARVLALGAFVPAALERRLTLGVNLGGVIRERARFANISQGSGLAWGVGGSYRVLDALWASAEVFGDVIPSGRYGAPTAGGRMGSAGVMSTIEALAGARYQVERRVNVGLAIGRGLTSGIGSPDLRGVLLVTVAPGAAAIVPMHGVGSPEGDRDSDGDGISDALDRCPHEPEDKDGFEDADGCPDLDNDHDGIPDAADKCPLAAEDNDGFQDEDGCPDPDNDGDGVPDARDKCPSEPEDKDGFEDADGCPDPDNDHDGIPDATDKCPNEPETINGIHDDDGCPDKGDGAVVLAPDRLELLEAFQFQGPRIAKASFNILGQVAATLRAHPEVVRVRVTVHVQPSGNDDADQALTDKRAQAVRDWLVQWGIAPSRLEARGFGGTRPLVPKDQSGASVINDRLELIILERN